MKQKLLGYEAPSTTIFVVKSQGCLCASPLYGSRGYAGAELDYNDYDEDF